MKNLIVGNGVNIQFGGLDYTNKSIIKRAIQNIKHNNYSEEVYSEDILVWIRNLHSFLPMFLSGGYDKYAIQQDEIDGLASINKRYKKDTKIYGIGFEDYFLMNDLACRYSKITNPERFYAQEFMRRFFLDSIFNFGKVNNIWGKFTPLFIEYLSEYDKIFTTNYDNNLEQVTKTAIIHLHGAFDTLSFVYDPSSFRNQLSDKPAIETPVVDGYEHLFSTAITYSSGKLKEFVLEQNDKSNSFFEKATKALDEDPELEKELLSWKESEHEPVRKLYEAIKLKQNDPSLAFPDEYHIKDFETIEGEVTYLGLSPYNDSHLFSKINNNKNIDKIQFYYYSNNEQKHIKDIFPNKLVDIIPVISLWKSIS